MKHRPRIILFCCSVIIFVTFQFLRTLTFVNPTGNIKQQLLDEVASARLELSSFQPFSQFPNQNIFIFQNDSLIFWPNNTTEADQNLLLESPGFIELNKGIYLLHKKKLAANKTLLFLKPIQEKPIIRNKYIEPFSLLPGTLSTVSKKGYLTVDLGSQKIYYKANSKNLADYGPFKPEFFASSSLNPSLGFLLINLFLLGSALFVFNSLISTCKKPNIKLLAIIPVFIVGALSVFILKGLIYDSKLTLEIFNLNRLRIYDLSIPIILIWFVTLLYDSITLFIICINPKKHFLFVLASLALYNIAMYKLNYYDLIEINWFVPLLCTPWLNAIQQTWKTIAIILCATFGWFYIITKHQNYKLNNELKIVADKLQDKDDPIAEYLIDNAIPELNLEFDKYSEVDSLKPTAISFLKENLFIGYLSRYEPELVSSIPQDKYYFKFNHAVFIITDKNNRTGFGFPELLANRDFANYSEKGFAVAKFKHKRLIQSSGNYTYRKNIPLNFQSPGFINYKNFKHFISYNNDQYVVVSYPYHSPIHKFAFAAYLFLLCLIGCLPFIKYTDFLAPGLQGKIQLSLLAVVIVTVVVFGVSTYIYLNEQFEDKNQSTLNEKAQSVEAELLSSNILGDTHNVLRLENILRKLSAVFFTDISIYDTKGQLLASSQPDVFTKGVLTNYMNPYAFHKLNTDGANAVIQKESIGKLTYLSAYRPISNEYNQTIGYINLPYFAKQIDLENQLSRLLVSLITALIGLSAMAVAVALILANRITEPLKAIRLKLQDIDLLNDNQLIDYKQADEIGDLVVAYNTKVQELIHKANALAKTERESAWREMAKQVAHEIKNPLTPIKLNAQLLQRVFKSNDPDAIQKTQRFIEGLLDQVDALAKIANEFSNYASLPKAFPEVIDFKLIVTNCATVMSSENIVISISIPEDSIFIYADKDLIIRAINNLVKNAIQAVEEKHHPHESDGQVNITITSLNEHVLFTINDNGPGIPIEIQNKLFVPNFTTKSTGMGLGLAVVKQIVEQADGEIYFTSNQVDGTSFFMKFPVVKPVE